MKIKKYKNDILITYMLYFVIYACMYIMHYATDTFNAIINAGIYGKGNISLGRYGCEVVYFIARLFNINYAKSFVFLITLMIFAFALFSTASSIHIQEMLKIDSDVSKWIIRLAMVLVFGNVFVQEWFVFWECSLQWSFSVFFLTLALTQLKRTIRAKNFICSCVFLILGLGFYQAILPIFLILGCTIVYIKNEGILTRKSFFETVLIVVIGGVASIVNLLSIKIFQIMGLAYVTGRTEALGIKVLINNLATFISVIPKMFIKTFGLYPKYLFAVLTVVLIGGSIINIIKKRIEIGNRILYLCLLVFFSIFSIFIPHLFTTSLWLAQRTLVGFWSIGSMLILVFWKTSNENRCAIKVDLIVATIMLLANFASIQSFQMDVVVCNSIDEQNAIVIQEKIDEYELNTGNEIKYIAVMHDKNTTYVNPMARYRYCDTNRSLLTTSWSDVASINFFNNTQYIKAEVPESIHNQYMNEDWTYFNPNEQLIFNADTLYLIIY